MTTNNQPLSYRNFPNLSVSAEEHLHRKDLHLKAGEALKQSIWNALDDPSFNLRYRRMRTDEFGLCRLAQNLSDKKELARANDPRWAYLPFGAVNTIEKSACVAFASYNLLKLAQQPVKDFLSIVDLAANNGYRQWRFANDPSRKVLGLPSIDVSEIVRLYPDNPDVQNCTTPEEIEKVLGPAQGIGGSMYFIDNLIEFYSQGRVRAYDDTRFYSWDAIVEALQANIAVPIRVHRGIYNANYAYREGHYVVLIGIHKGYALVVDSSNQSIDRIPLRRFLLSVVCGLDAHDKRIDADGYIVAWNATIL